MMMKLIPLLASVFYLATKVQGWTVYPCYQNALGVENPNVINNNQMSASSERNNQQAARRGRLNMQKVGALAGGWSAANNDASPYLQIDLHQIHMITGVKTQGRSDAAEWVTSHEVWYTISGEFTGYRTVGSLSVKQFSGNSDQNSIVYHLINNTFIYAQYVQFRPKTWHNHASMRVELMGCPQLAQGVIVRCNANQMEINIRKNILLPLGPNEIHLIEGNNANCQGSEVTIRGVPYYRLRTPLNGCGTTCSASNEYITYANRVTETNMVPGQQISRLRRIMMPFTCSYRNVDVKSSIRIEPNISVLYISEHGTGVFPCQLDIYTSRYYNVTYVLQAGHNALHVQLNTRMYMQVTFTSGDPHLWMRVSRCWASPLSNSNSVPQWVLISNGCAVDQTVILYSRGNNGKTQRFSFLSFLLFKHHQYVFIHCRIRVCKGRSGFCNQPCGIGKKRGLPEQSVEHDEFEHHYEHVVTHGPFTVHKQLAQPNVNTDKRHMDRSNVDTAELRVDPVNVDTDKRQEDRGNAGADKRQKYRANIETDKRQKDHANIVTAKRHRGPDFDEEAIENFMNNMKG